MGTPTWLRNDLKDALDNNHVQKCSKFSDSVQLKSSTSSKKSNNSRTSVSKLKQNRNHEKCNKVYKQVKTNEILDLSGKKSEKPIKIKNKKKISRLSSQKSVKHNSY